MIEDEPTVILVTFSTSAKFVRIIGKTIVPSTINIRAEIATGENTTHERLSTSLAKIKYFFDNIVAQSIAFSADNGDALDMLVGDNGINRCANMFMLLPSEPTDDILAAVLQSKMEALANGSIFIEACEVKSDNPIGLSFTLVGDGVDLLPDMIDWIGPVSYFEKPWWERDDASILDVSPPPGADLTKKPEWAYSLDRGENAVVKGEFRPTIIDGKKKGKGKNGGKKN